MLVGQLGRRAIAQAHGRTVVAMRPVAGRRVVAFKGAKPSVRVNAAAGDAPATIKLADVKAGEEYEGTVTSVEEYGAFVDFGSSTNGLVHISKMGPGFTKSVKDVVSKGQKVTVKVLSVDAAKNRVSLELKSGATGAPAAAAATAEASAEESGDEEARVELATDAPGEEDAAAADEDEEVEVELEDGQVEVYSDLPGFEDIPFVLEEEDADELTETAVAALEQNLEDAEIRYELEAPAYMEEVTGTVARVEDYGVFLEFSWNGKTLTGLLSRDEMKVRSSALSEEAQQALRAEWADTEFEMPQFVELPDDELDVKKYYQPGDEVPAFVLESALIDSRGISLTHFTDEDVAAVAIDAAEDLEDDDDDEELTKLLDEVADLEDEVLAFDPEDLVDEDEDDVVGVVGAESADYEGVDEDAAELAVGTHSVGVTRAGLISGKNGLEIGPLGLPERPLVDVDINSAGLAGLRTTETDFDGDEVQLADYFTSEIYDNTPKDILKQIGLRMRFNEQGEAEFEEREGYDAEAELSLDMFHGDLQALARDLVADILDEDTDEAELPARAGRRPVPL